MSITQSVVSVGTAVTTVVEPTSDWAEYVIKNIQPATVDGMARNGYVYLIGRQFKVANAATAGFSIMSGATGTQLDFYEIISDTSNVFAELIEDATITTAGSPITAHNLNRNYADNHTSVLHAASSITGGTTVSAEYVTATNQGGGAIASSKIHTLKPNTQYGMKFTNQGSHSTTIFFQLGFSEHYNGYNDIWLGTTDGSFVLRGGEELKMTLNPNATINAVAKTNGNKLAIMRQE